MTISKNNSNCTKAAAKTAIKQLAAYAKTPQPTTLVSALCLKKNQSLATEATLTLTNKAIIQKPNPNDILFGRGGESNNAQGNQRYQKLIGQHVQEYSELRGRKDKTKLAWKIYNDIRQEGARFLKKVKGTKFWMEAPEVDCRKKISQRLREMALDAKDKLGVPPPQKVQSAPKEAKKTKKTSSPAVTCERVDDDASIATLLLDTDLSESDGSIESLVDFADDFPASWMMEPRQPEEVPSAPLVVSSYTSVVPDPVASSFAPLFLEPSFLSWQGLGAFPSVFRVEG